jgi:asparagine synthetase B (glutamine-hydrolysing)
VNPAGLTELEVASGIVVGRGTGHSFDADRRLDPIAVLRSLCRLALTKEPCVVAFSGGRDSSVLLAVLVDVAREEGLAEPIAVTARWDQDEASDERIWQEQVIRAIGIRDWQVIRPGTDLDLLGAEATWALDKLNLLWPAPAYAFLPMIRIAAGGVLITGEGGDEAFGLWPFGHLWSTLRNRHLPIQSELQAFALACCPRPLRRRIWQRRVSAYQEWLRPDAFEEVSRMLANDEADDPLRWDRYQVVSRCRRAVDLSVRTFQGISGLHGTEFVGPFLDEKFLSALAAWGGPLGKGDRTTVMTRLFADLLAGPILSRTSKASFGGVFWGPRSRKFAEDWQGSGINTELIDPEVLRREWLKPVPVFGAALPLHAAWLYERKIRHSVGDQHP